MEFDRPAKEGHDDRTVLPNRGLNLQTSPKRFLISNLVVHLKFRRGPMCAGQLNVRCRTVESEER